MCVCIYLSVCVRGSELRIAAATNLLAPAQTIKSECFTVQHQIEKEGKRKKNKSHFSFSICHLEHFFSFRFVVCLLRWFRMQ